MARDWDDFEDPRPGQCLIAAFEIPGHTWVVYMFTDDGLHPESPDDAPHMQRAKAIYQELFELLDELTKDAGGGYSLDEALRAADIDEARTAADTDDQDTN